MADITPSPHILQSMASQGMTWPKALAELVDNSFDAGASRVTIRYLSKERTLIVEDDGAGIKDVLSIVRLGCHDPHTTTALGMFGIGSKDVWCYTGGAIKIETVRGGKKTVLEFDARKQLDWKCADPSSVDTNEPSGTKLAMPLIDRSRPNPQAYERLAFIFTPAIRKGLQIIVGADTNGKNQRLKPVELPPFSEVVEAAFEIDGREVEIRIGIVQDGFTMPDAPFWLQYGHRIIQSTDIGVGQYSYRRIGGVITLGKGWPLTKNKDALNDKYRESLADAIFVRIEHLLKKGEVLDSSVETAAIRNELSTAIGDAIKGGSKGHERKKEKRSAGESVGTALPRETGRKRRNAKDVHADQPGSVEISEAGRRRGFILDFCEDDERRIGKFDGLSLRVSLNANFPLVAAAMKSKDRSPMLLCAFALIADYATTHRDGNKLLSFECEGFKDSFANLVYHASALRGEKQDAK